MQRFIVDYLKAKTCKNEKAIYSICLLCGKCGRIFDDYGIMLDNGGTKPIEEEQKWQIETV